MNTINLSPARRVLSGHTASQEQRQAAADMLSDAPTRKLTDAEIASINLYHDAVAQGDAHMCAKLAAMNMDRYGDDGDTRPVIGWLLIGVVVGAVLALLVLA